MLAILAAFFGVAGAGHFLVTDSVVKIVPDWVPYPYAIVIATGVFELAVAAALFVGPLRPSAGVLLALYALAVWPANFKHAFGEIALAPLTSSWWYHGPRLAFQPVIIWWALYATGVIDWPWRRSASKFPD